MIDQYYMLKGGYILKVSPDRKLSEIPLSAQSLFYNFECPPVLTQEEASYRKKIFREEILDLDELLIVIAESEGDSNKPLIRQ